jgi:hypothetical protein
MVFIPFNTINNYERKRCDRCFQKTKKLVASKFGNYNVCKICFMKEENQFVKMKKVIFEIENEEE